MRRTPTPSSPAGLPARCAPSPAAATHRGHRPGDRTGACTVRPAVRWRRAAGHADCARLPAHGAASRGGPTHVRFEQLPLPRRGERTSRRSAHCTAASPAACSTCSTRTPSLPGSSRATPTKPTASSSSAGSTPRPTRNEHEARHHAPTVPTAPPAQCPLPHAHRSERVARPDMRLSSWTEAVAPSRRREPVGRCCEGRGRQWERRGRGERAVAERSPSPFSTPPLERAQ